MQTVVVVTDYGNNVTSFKTTNPTPRESGQYWMWTSEDGVTYFFRSEEVVDISVT